MSTPGTHDGDDEIFETSDEELELQGDMSVPSAPALGFASLSDSELFEGDSIEEPRIDALKAFETFMGRTYDTAERKPKLIGQAIIVSLKVENPSTSNH